MKEVITTRQAECKDCYRCLRNCPVKAIGFAANQAKIEENRCVLCGRCVVECPQKAKMFSNQAGLVRQMLLEDGPIVLSIAPSFMGSFEESPGQLFERICRAGFADVEETAIGAALTTREYRRLLATEAWQVRTGLSTCCPVIVNLVEQYFPHLVPNLLPVQSPMVAHAQLIKAQRGGKCRVVFVGPCIAKLAEANKYGLDGALTFGQLKGLLLELSGRPPQATSGQYKYDKEWLPTRSFPIHNGVLYNVKGAWGSDQDYWSIEGLDQCLEVLRALENDDIRPRFIEMMACQGGCVGGPAIDSGHTLYRRKQMIQDMIRQSASYTPAEVPVAQKDMGKGFQPRAIKDGPYTEEEINDVLRKMGKDGEKDLRNCEGCGYGSCRDKAIAVLAGLATVEMCIPFMRSKAESLANMVMENTPNGILVVDRQMILREWNPAVMVMLPEIPLAVGLDLSRYMDTGPYRQAALSQVSIYDHMVEYPQWDLVTRQTIVPVPEESLLLVVMEDITALTKERQELDEMKDSVTEKAKSVINQQMRVAQEIAGLLGETTAETKASLYELLKHLEDRSHGHIL